MLAPYDKQDTDLRLVTLDYETYFDDEYSLGLKRNKTKGIEPFTYAEYVADPRFEVQLLTLTDNGGAVQHAWGEREVRELLLDSKLDSPDTVTCAHNGRFDHYVTEQYFGIRQWMSTCTILLARETGLARLCDENLDAMSSWLRDRGFVTGQKGKELTEAKGHHLEDMSPLFRERFLGYGVMDTSLADQIARVLIPLVTWDGMRAISMSLEMYTRPVFQLNKALLQDYLATLVKKRNDHLSQIYHKYGCASVDDFLTKLRSKPKFADLLRSVGVEPPMKLSVKRAETARKKNPDAPDVMDYAFSKDDLAFQALADHYRPEVADLVNARIEHNGSQSETRTAAFIRVAERGGGWFPVPLEFCRAHPGRYGGADAFNVQNLPKRTGDKTLRKSIVAPPGWLVGGADSSQVEARLLAYAAQEHSMLSVFSSGGDPYVVMAEDIYAIPAAEIRAGAKMDEEYLKTIPADHPDAIRHFQCYVMRSVGKETILASGYSMSGRAFADRLKTNGITLKPSHSEAVEFLQNLKTMTDYDLRRGAKPTLDFYNPAQRDDYFLKWYHDFHGLEAKRINKLYRGKHQKITAFWGTCDWVLSQLVQGLSGYFGGPDGKLFFYDGSRKLLGETVPGIMLPNGYWLNYPQLKATQEVNEATKRKRIVYTYRPKKDKRYTTEYLYGGKVTENLMQGLSFALLRWQAIRIHQYVPVKLNVHDEWMSVFREEELDYVREVYLSGMRARPAWLRDAPINCEFTYGVNYGEC